MSRRDGREVGNYNERPFALSSVPSLVDLDKHKRAEQVWARLTAALGTRQAQPASAETPAPRRKRLQALPRASADEAVRELQVVESVQPGATVSLCPLTNKVQHESKLWALHHRNRLACLPDEHHPERLSVYKCKSCGDWHVGHKV